MKVNIISIDNKHSLSTDSQLVREILNKFYSRKKKITFEFCPFHKNTANIADVNIFIGIISNSFFKYAPINIFVIDPHKFYKVWIPLFKKLDYIIVRNDYGKNIIENFVEKEKIINIGWKIQDKYIYSIEKKFNEYLFIIGLSNYRCLDEVLDIWDKNYPKLTILCNKHYFKNIKKKEQENIIYIEKYLNTTEYLKLINSIGIHLCLSSISSMGNTLHDCLLSKSIPVVLDCAPYRDYVINNITGFIVNQKKKKKLKNFLGSEFILDKENLKHTIEEINKIIEIDELKLEEMTEKGKKQINCNNREFEKNFKDFYDKIWKQLKNVNKLKTNYDCFDEDFPGVSIITPTYNRKYLFNLSIRNFEKTDYPQDKIEWIIIDDSENENLKDILPSKENIKYIKLNERKTIGEKRNIAVENSKNDIIVCMDDDDYYPPMSVKKRVASLIHLNKKLVGCTSLGILEVNKIISIVSGSSYTLNYYDRFFESTLAFTKEYWNKNKFEDKNTNESSNMIKDNLGQIEEIDWNQVLVNLKHENNTNNVINVKGETNGSHFNLPDEVFEIITNIDKK